jgi:uncharacterized membrane protein
MPDQQKQLDELNKKLHLIELRQQQINSDLILIKKELSQFTPASPLIEHPMPKALEEFKPKPIEQDDDRPLINLIENTKSVVQPLPAVPKEAKEQKNKEKTPLEEFIGTNLLNKIGIAVLVIGIGIGAKYAIDHDLINPLTRIIIGYVCGLILIGLSVRLKPTYLNFSAVLLSGGMAVLYFITFAAYDLYQLLPQALAFVLMVIFTVFTVFAAVQYNLQAVAFIGLVGAYGVPFLLSDGSGRVVILFSYMSILNIGILILSFKKTWKALYYTAFLLTWIIYAAWFANQYNSDDQLWISLVFSSIFFVIFYTTLLSYKLLQKEPLNILDIALVLTNSFVYYLFGCAAIDKHPNGDFFLGSFTLFNAILHFIACYIIYKKQNATRDTFFLVAGMVLVFITLAVPVQLDGNWVTLIWAAEAVLLFWIGRSKKFPVYERLSYALVLLTVISLIHDWIHYYGRYTKGDENFFIPFFLNIQFFTSIVVCVALGAIYKISTRNKEDVSHWLTKIFSWVLPALFIATLYLSFYQEINNHWDQLYTDSAVFDQNLNYSHFDNDLLHLQDLWLMIYTAIFITLSAGTNRWINNKYFDYLITGSSIILLLGFVIDGLPQLIDLRDSYLTQEDANLYTRNAGNILIRYVSILFMLPLLWIIRKNIHVNGIANVLKKTERVFFHFIILTLLSSELINVLDLLKIEDSDKLALSILYGMYALGLIIYGLVKDLRFTRILAIVLFGITLVKLFFYDLSSMGTIAKTIVMMTLGVLLLVASFLYNKYRKSTSSGNTDQS